MIVLKPEYSKKSAFCPPPQSITVSNLCGYSKAVPIEQQHRQGACFCVIHPYHSTPLHYCLYWIIWNISSRNACKDIRHTNNPPHSVPEYHWSAPYSYHSYKKITVLYYACMYACTDSERETDKTLNKLNKYRGIICTLFQGSLT